MDYVVVKLHKNRTALANLCMLKIDSTMLKFIPEAAFWGDGDLEYS
jgi:hypothetical protein